MKKLFLLFISYCLLFTNLSAQETFFKFLQGWKSRKIYELSNSYIIASTDATIPYQNHSDFSEISLIGDSVTNWIFEVDSASSTDVYYTNCYSSIINEYIYVTGYITGNESGEFYGFLSKFTSDLETEIWTKILPDQHSPNFRVLKIKNDTSIIIGTQNMYNNNIYTSFIETDSSGVIRWQKDFDCSGDCHLSPFHILPTVDNGFIFTCYEDHINGQPGVEDIQMAIIKTDSMGNEEWRETWGGDSTKNFGSWVVPLDDGNYLYAWTDNEYSGYGAQSNYDNTVRFAKFDIDGNIIWYKDISEQLSGRNFRINQMELMPDGNIILAGYNGVWGGLIKVDQDANLVWYRGDIMPPGMAYEDNTATMQQMKILGVTFTSDDGLILAGEYISSEGNIFPNGIQSAYAYKLDSWGCYEENCHVGIEEKELITKGFSIYPNPANEEIIVTCHSEQSEESLLIYDITGKLVKQVSLRGTKQSIQISDLESGVYFVKVGVSIQKLIVE